MNRSRNKLLNMIVNKKEFLSNVNEWCWARVDLTDEDGAFIPEEVCATYTKWLEEWVERFNAMEQGFKVKLLIEENNYGGNYRICRIIVKDIKFPKWDDIDEIEFYLESEKAGEISKESRTDEETDEEEDSDEDE